MRQVRVVFTEPQSARANISVTAAIAELHVAGESPDTLRLYSYPKSVLLGRHQPLESINVAECEKRNVEIARRLTGGGAIYMDRGVITWDFIVGTRDFGGGITRSISEIGKALAASLSRFGLPAESKKENEVEIGGKKVCGISGYYDGATYVCQGSILVDVDLKQMSSVLRDSRSRGAPATHEVINIADMMGRRPDNAELFQTLAVGIAHHFNFTPQRMNLSDAERKLADRLFDEEYGRDQFVFGEDSRPNKTKRNEAGRVRA